MLVSYPDGQGQPARLCGLAMRYDHSLDTRGLLCPLPVLKARKRLQNMALGEVLQMQADDPAAMIDVPHFCDENGHELLASGTCGDSLEFLIRKGA